MKRIIAAALGLLLIGGGGFLLHANEQAATAEVAYNMEDEAPWSSVDLPEDYGVYAVTHDAEIVRMNHAGVMQSLTDVSDLPPLRRFLLHLPGISTTDLMAFSQSEALIIKVEMQDELEPFSDAGIARHVEEVMNLTFLNHQVNRRHVVVDLGPVSGESEMVRLTAREPLGQGMYALFAPLGARAESGLFIAPFTVQRAEGRAAHEEFLETEEGQDAIIGQQVIRVRADLRSMATAIETYYIDNNRYPTQTSDLLQSIHAQFAEQLSDHRGAGVPTFRRATPRPGGDGMVRDPAERVPVPMGQRLHTLTTPIAYFSSYPGDPFAPVGGMTYNYFDATAPASAGGQAARGWIVWSPGPNGDYDLDLSAYDPRLSIEENRARLAPFTYDPTNGAVSRGDIWRIKE